MTVYPVIGTPPVLVGAVQRTVACASPAEATTPVGGDGGAAGRMDADGGELGLVPSAFVAVTVKV